MFKTLNKDAKFEMLQFDNDKKLNYVLNLDEKLSMLFKI